MNIIELRGVLIARHKSELAAFDSKATELVALAGESGTATATSAIPALAPPEPVTRTETRTMRIGGPLRDLIETLHGEFTTVEIGQKLNAMTRQQISCGLNNLKRAGYVESVRYGVYRRKGIAHVTPSTPSAVPSGTIKAIGTDCAKAIRRAIALMTLAKFTRDDIQEQMRGFVDERTLKGWQGSGGFSSTLLDLRNGGMLNLLEHKPPAQAVYEKGARFEAVIGV